MQTIAAALIAAIHSLPSGGERVQHYRAVQDVQSAADACVDKYTLRNSEGDRQADTLPPDDPNEEARWRTARRSNKNAVVITRGHGNVPYRAILNERHTVRQPLCDVRTPTAHFTSIIVRTMVFFCVCKR